MQTKNISSFNPKYLLSLKSISNAEINQSEEIFCMDVTYEAEINVTLK